MPARGLAWSLLLLAACNDEVARSEVPLALVCGTEGPHRLFAHAADEHLASVTRLGARLFYIVDGQDQPTRVHATGLCGEDPVLVARDLHRVFSHERWPDVVLGCRYQDLMVVDASGGVEPRLVVPGGCRATWTEHGLVTVEVSTPISPQGSPMGSGRAELFPFPPGSPTGEIEPITLADTIPYAYDGPPVAEASDDALFAVNHEYELVRISLADRSQTVEQSWACGLDVSRDGRWLVWHDCGGWPNGDDVDLILRDRETGEERVIGRGDLSYGDQVIGERFIHARDGDLLLLPSLALYEKRPDLHLLRELPDGRWLGFFDRSGVRVPDAWMLVDLARGEETHLVDHHGPAYPANDHLDLIQDDHGGELWRHFYDGRPPEQLAERASLFKELADGRIATALDRDGEGIGELVLVERGTLVERRIEARARELVTEEGVAPADAVAYTVVDGERSGLWLARPAAE
ncbi:hypothetical protein [Nannocystis pusilla]|uniref:Uncharacterized protein n=1 Tax=Nannocystis pusilla TaxID=889268 RepID=A0ABS7TWD8_9BACT|nr:hypothetical protein [Nannocystis pusilla]MBZ5712572.1 hypothetical protein [Nannocystis pusilla]